MPSERPFPEGPGGPAVPVSELRLDFPGGRWILFAPGRAKRPNDFKPGKGFSGGDSSRASCPFCPGRESETPPEVAALRDHGTAPDTPGWRVRVVPNKFPALVRPAGPPDSPDSEEESPARPGFGIHEVLIDGPEHDMEWADYPDGRIRDVLTVMRDRLKVLEQDPSIRYIQVFKNRGGAAGASLRHPHTQILALPVLPGQVRDEVEAMTSRGQSTGLCPACRLMAEEETGPRLVSAGREFLALVPFASRFPYEMHIRPRRHAARLSGLTDSELDPLAHIMGEMFRRLRSAAGDPAYHLVLRQAPAARASGGEERRIADFNHWRFEILPVLGATAGFEWGTGCFINPVLPERAAAALRRG